MNNSFLIQLIVSQQKTVADFEPADESLFPVPEIRKILHKTEENISSFYQNIYLRYVDECLPNGEPLFKLAQSKSGLHITLYIKKKGIPHFIQSHKKELLSIGVHPAIIHSIITNTSIPKRGETTYTLNQLFEMFNYREFKLNQLDEKTIERMLDDTYISANNEVKPLIFYTLNLSNKPSLSIEREAIGVFLAKWGKALNIPEKILIQARASASLPETCEERISISEMALQIGANSSLVNWLNEQAVDIFKNDIIDGKPLFIRARTKNMRPATYILRAGINYFLQKYRHLLPEGNHQTLKTDSAPTTYPIRLRLDQALSLFKKANGYLPHIKKLVFQTTAQDTFPFDLGNGQTKEMPICVITQEDRKKPIIFIYQDGMPYFAKKHEEALLKMNVSYEILSNLFKKAHLPYLKNNTVIKLYDLYLASFSSLSEDEFEDCLVANAPDSIQVQNSFGQTEQINPLIVVQTLKQRYIALHSITAYDLLEKNAEALKLSTTDLLRLKTILNQQNKPILNIYTLLSEMGLNIHQRTTFKNNHLLSNTNLIQENPQQKEVIVFFNKYKDKRTGFVTIGVYEDAIYLFIQRFYNELISLGATPQKLMEIAHRFVPQKIVSSHKKINPPTPERQKES